VVIFDIDGTLLDSADGIVAGFQHALRSAGIEPPDEGVLRSDLGPPIGDLFGALGLSGERLATAVTAYRDWYLEHGIRRSAPYAGVPELLDALHGTYRLATATAKRTDAAAAILGWHRLADHFEVINGTNEQHNTKSETARHTLDLLGSPDPATAVLVGDRHSDIAAARTCGVRSIGVGWGYGSAEELTTAEPDVFVERPEDLRTLLTG
jgi:phosphoglycolate phosphatase